jgi:hypothetical protein
MRKIVLLYGFIGGMIIAGLLVLNTWLMQLGIVTFNNSMVVGYTSMAIALSMVFMGVRSYRNTSCGGVITFGRAFGVGILIALIASAFYVGAWEIYLATDAELNATFMNNYKEFSLTRMRNNGASAAEVAEAKQKLDEMCERYKDPAARVGTTFMEIFPVGLIVTLFSAAVLRKREVLPA